MPLPAFVPGTIGVLHVQAIGMEPAPHLMLAARRGGDHHQRAQRFGLLAFQGALSANGAPAALRTTLKGLSRTMSSAPCSIATRMPWALGHSRGLPRPHPLEPRGNV